MRKQPAFLLLVCLLPSVAQAAEAYVTTGFVSPYVDWDCTGFICDETTAGAAMLGYGHALPVENLFVEGDLFFTYSNGEIDDFAGAGRYSVNGFGAYGVWRTRSWMSLSLRAGLAHTDVDGPAGYAASGSTFGPAYGIGVGFGRHFQVDYRGLSDRVSSLNFTLRFGQVE